MDFEQALAAFITNITEAKEADRAKNFSTLERTIYTAQRGRKNIRIVTDEHKPSASVFCFVRIDDGAVLKAAGWKAPAKGQRGTIFTEDPKEYGCGVYGANYLR